MNQEKLQMNIINDRFAKSDEEAEKRYQQNKANDPFPEIPPALLNSADIEDYVAITGMIYPFYSDPNFLKPASYEIKLLGKCVYWDEKGDKQVENIEEGKGFVLHRNSIAFVTLEPMFRLPDYIALRFNLKITHVYRGLLLGTGPLVDPGYHQRLSIPLHNLTTNEYTLRGGEGLIWMEFTKISPIKKLSDNENNLRKGSFVHFPERKNKLKDVEDYLYKADPHRPIRSSIPIEIQKAIDIANQAKNRVYIISVVGALTILGFIYGLFNPTFQLLQDSVNYVVNAQSTHHADIKEMKLKIVQLENKLQNLNVIIENFKSKLVNTAVKSEAKPNRAKNINTKN
jgi:deoxycytidine triphosphate deaminase